MSVIYEVKGFIYEIFIIIYYMIFYEMKVNIIT